jgi:stage IV sporulation protein A
MENLSVYEDIAKRTDGDIYVGVVGPVRCGKSTFITSFMNSVVLPNITNVYNKQRTIDELPQSADGKTIMTTEPKFVPNEAVNISLSDKINLKVRMIDCVGYMINGAIGGNEEEKPRLVKSPWSEKEIPFELAAEIGTQKVIQEHSTIALMMTTDGTITNLSRENYISAEEKVVSELKKYKKPFVILLNTTKPKDDETDKLKKELETKYNAPVLPIDAKNLNEEDITSIFDEVLTQFPLVSVVVTMPPWLQVLPFDNPLIQEIVNEVSSLTQNVNKIGDFTGGKLGFEKNDNFEPLVVKNIVMGEGKLIFNVTPKPSLFYKILSDECKVKINSDYELISYLKELTSAKTEFDKIKDAFENAKNNGYGVVYPKMEEMTLSEPEIIKQGGRSGVKLRASAPSFHIMKVDIETEINPIVGSEVQSEDLVKSMLKQFETNPNEIWNTNIFGKSLNSLVSEGINNKISAMPNDVQTKMRKTLSRVVNEGKGGIICILL